MRFDNGKEVDSWTAMDNEILSKICRISDLSKGTKDVFVSLCQQTFFQDESNTVSTSGWGAAKVTADRVGISERQVRNAYRKLEERNMIRRETKIREKDIQGRPVPRKVLWITINTDVDTWKVQEW